MKRHISEESALWLCRMWEFYDNLSVNFNAPDMPVVFDTTVTSGFDDVVVQVRLTNSGFKTRMSNETVWGDAVDFDQCTGPGVDILRDLYKSMLVV